VILGHVVQAGAGPNPARLGAAAGGIPMGVPATTLNKLCLSGLAAIAQAAQQIMTGQSETLAARKAPPAFAGGAARMVPVVRRSRSRR
jgi:acetyl-CoA C-acetyltransferase